MQRIEGAVRCKDGTTAWRIDAIFDLLVDWRKQTKWWEFRRRKAIDHIAGKFYQLPEYSFTAKDVPQEAARRPDGQWND